MSLRAPTLRRKVTSFDVARAAGVSQSAVSRCFRAGASLSPALRSRIEEAARALGYVPNNVARSLITGSTGLVGVAIADQTLRSYPELLSHLGRHLRARKRSLVLFGLERDEAVGAELPRMLESQVDGLISLVAFGPDHLDRCRARGLPVVFLNRTSGAASSVCCDNVESMRQLATRVVEAGYRDIAVLAGGPDSPASRARITGFLGRLGEFGLAAPEVAHADFSFEGGWAAAEALLGRADPPRLVACANDAMAFGVLDAARTRFGLRVPEQLAVTGFDDTEVAGHPGYSLTTVRQEADLMCEAAISVLERAAAGAAEPVCRLVPGTIVVRGSAPI